MVMLSLGKKEKTMRVTVCVVVVALVHVVLVQVFVASRWLRCQEEQRQVGGGRMMSVVAAVIQGTDLA